MSKNVESEVPNSMRVCVVHLHPGNSTESDRSTSDDNGWEYYHKYMTIAKLRDKKSNEVVSEGVSYCSGVDNPCRKIGRAVAVGRAVACLN